ncbi:ROK family protein [Lysobacter korlensis]|uniref:ROK family protein n=1 Tax=Lysobacter korlensis TaxID=553636 RepID=A0ABV6RV13_9GAMM
MRAGIDIGGTKTDAVVLADDGTLAHRLRLPTGFGSEVVLDTAHSAVLGLADLASVDPSGFATIGVGIPGTVDSSSGRVSHAVNLGFDDLDLGERLATRLGRDVRIENDVNAAALGAFHLLGLPGSSSMAYLNLGTGLAAGLVLRGSLWRGARGAAGEIGHIPIDPAGAECPCGQRGCLETVASGSAVARMWPTADSSPVTALFSAAEAGDPAAIVVARNLVENVAAAVRLLVLTVDVETVVIGGGLSALGPRLISEARAVLGGWGARSPFLASLGLGDRVQLVPAGAPAAAIGAALIG